MGYFFMGLGLVGLVGRVGLVGLDEAVLEAEEVENTI